MHLRSLRFKLTLWYVLILGVLLTSFSGFLYFTLSKSLYRDVDNKLKSLAELIASESSSPLSKFSFGTIDQALEASMNLKPIGKFIQVLDESGNIGRKSDNLRNVQLPISLNALKNASKGSNTFETNRTIENTPLRIMTFPVVENGHVTKIVQIASSLEGVEDALNKLFLILIISVPSTLILASLGGQFLAHKALKPVDDITQTARMITSKNLNQRINPPKVKDEISRLIETFNEMISRLDQSFQQMKQFSSDASHELKTPLTILKGEVEVMLRRERTSHEYQQTLKSNLEEINRMSQIVEDLLTLSKADTGEIGLNKEDINLTEILNEVVAQMNRLASSKKLDLSSSNHDEDIHLFGDALRLRELFINLIENGIKYTEEGGSIRIFLQKVSSARNQSGWLEREKDELVKIIVSDTGIGIAQEDQERIFDRFFRVDKAR
ncbi:MAG: histidine kinase dimerization/phospho-acceptor domain-containing protein, partial [Thermodesulfobacteriota bacterium]